MNLFFEINRLFSLEIAYNNFVASLTMYLKCWEGEMVIEPMGPPTWMGLYFLGKTALKVDCQYSKS